MRSKRDIPTPVGEAIRLGTVETVDLGEGRVTIKSGDVVTDSIRWLTGRAGETRSWSPPSVGEQVVLICPEGEIEGAIALPGIYSNLFSQPGSTKRELIQFFDGAVLAYDPENHSLEAFLPENGVCHILAPGGVTFYGDVTINGDVSVDGTVDASTDVIGDGVSLKGHRHTDVEAGGSLSGQPQ